MKALVYHGPHLKSLENCPLPTIKTHSDAIVRIMHTTICGTDLHVLYGNVPTVDKGRILGHEGVGIIEEIGSSVSNFKVGDCVLISCNTSCGHCPNCRRALTGQCLNGGWVLGNTSDGCQAEYVRIPYADNSLYLVPKGVDHRAFVMLSDVLPTAFELGVKAGKIEPGQTVAVIGAGPVGLAAVISAQFYSPAQIIVIDINEHRLQAALTMGATHSINNKNNDAIDQIIDLTKGRGVDVAIECIGLPVGFAIAESIVCGGGNIAMLGVHSQSVTLHLEEMWKKNFTLTAGLVHTTTIPMLMQAVLSNKINPKALISHYFTLGELLSAYDTFANAEQTQSLKVILSNV